MADPDERHHNDGSLSIIYTQDEADGSLLSETLHTVPSYIARGLLYIVLLFISVALVCSVFYKIDIITSVSAVIIPEGKVRNIQPFLPGIVQQIYVREGERVTKDQTLMMIDSEEVGGALADLRAKEADFMLAKRHLVEIVPQKSELLRKKIRDEREKFALQEAIHKLSQQKLQENRKRHELELQDAIAALHFVEKELEIHHKLRDLGLIADIRLLEVQRSREEALSRIENIKSMLRDMVKEGLVMEKNLAMTRKQHEILIRDLQAEMTRRHQEAEEKYGMAELRYEQARELAHLNLRGVSRHILEQVAQGEGRATNRTAVVAPEHGIISQVLVRNTGEAVERGQTLMTLIPQEAALVAELRIPNQDIGTIRSGQTIRLKFDAFPYAEYGAIVGHIERILPEAQLDNSGASFYRAIAALRQTYFRVGASIMPLRPGMTAVAEIVTDRKTVFELLLQPFMELGQPHEAAK